MTLLRNIYLFCILCFPAAEVNARGPEPFQPHGKGSGLIFANFHKGITQFSKDNAAFELVRAYLGYEHFLSPEYSARLTLDIGSPDDVSPYSKLRRYAYFKYAYGQYEKNGFTFQFGLISTLHFKLQEQLWERRYMRKAFADEFRLGPSADLGTSVVYRFSRSFEADFSMMNGEGYSRLQMDDKFKYAAGLTFDSGNGLINRAYIDYMKNGTSQVSYTWLTSYTCKKNLNLVFEYNYQQNHDLVKGRDLYGYSLYGKYNLHPSWQLFARFDMLNSNITEDSSIPWHLAEDGSALIAGVQLSPVKGIKIALNYQDWVPRALNLANRSYLFVDMEIKL